MDGTAGLINGLAGLRPRPWAGGMPPPYIYAEAGPPVGRLGAWGRPIFEEWGLLCRCRGRLSALSLAEVSVLYVHDVQHVITIVWDMHICVYLTGAYDRFRAHNRPLKCHGWC